MKFSSEWIFTQRQAWEREVAALKTRGGVVPQERLDEMEAKFQKYEKDAWRFDQQIGKRTPGEGEGSGASADSLAGAVVAAVKALKDDEQRDAAAKVTSEVKKAVPKKAPAKKAPEKKNEGETAE